MKRFKSYFNDFVMELYHKNNNKHIKYADIYLQFINCKIMLNVVYHQVDHTIE